MGKGSVGYLQILRLPRCDQTGQKGDCHSQMKGLVGDRAVTWDYKPGLLLPPQNQVELSWPRIRAPAKEPSHVTDFMPEAEFSHAGRY